MIIYRNTVLMLIGAKNETYFAQNQTYQTTVKNNEGMLGKA